MARSAPTDPAFSESSPYRPNSPYAASKAASDHLVRAFVATYGMPALITNCSNNYGPYQHPEKLIPLMIIHALEGKPLPIYGDGSNVRDWLHVSDHCEALMSVIERGRIGETYNVGGGNERNNRDVVGLICDTIDRAFAADPASPRAFRPVRRRQAQSCRSLITYVTDRPGHDHRYAIDADETRDRTRQPMQRRFRNRTRPDRSLVSRPGGLVARRDQRRLQGLDRQELRLPDRGLSDHAHPRAQRGLSALPGLALSPPARARERLLCDADGGAQCEPVRRRRFLFAEFCRAGPSRRRRSTSTIHGCSRRGRASTAWQSKTPEPPGGAGHRELPGWLQRAVKPFKPLLRPLARKVGLSPKLDAQAEKILLAQIEEFRPDLIINQDIFHVDTGLMRRIKSIGNPILIGQVGIEPSRGEDWSVYDLMISQLPTTVRSFRALGVRAEVNHLAFEPAILDALPTAPAADIDVSFVGTVSVGPPAADRIAGGRRRALRSQIMGKPAAGAARLLAAAPLLSGRGLGRRHVSGAAALAHHAQLAYRHGRPGGRKHAAVRGDRRRRVPADRLQGQSGHAVRAGPRSRGVALDRRLPRGHRPRDRRRQRPRRDRARRPCEDHGAAHLSPSRRRDSRHLSTAREAKR